MKHQDKIEEAFDSLKKVKKVEAPNGLYDQVMLKIQKNDERKTTPAEYLKWAAIGLLILVNTLSYVKFQGDSTNENNASSEYQISDFVSEYGLNDYNQLTE